MFPTMILMNLVITINPKACSLKMNTALEYSTRVVQEGGRRCKKNTLNDLIHLTPLRIPLTLSLAARAGKKLPLHKESLQSGS
jgi:hypothetical protein